MDIQVLVKGQNQPPHINLAVCTNSNTKPVRKAGNHAGVSAEAAY